MEARAKFDFNATADDELTFQKGDTLKILGTNDDWLKAEMEGLEGFVPKNYLNFDYPCWYKEAIGRQEAQEMLLSRPLGSFLIRSSQSSPGDFSISVRHDHDVQHFKVMRDTRGQYYLWSETFTSLNRLVDYYSQNSISKSSRVLLRSPDQRQQGLRGPAEPPLPQQTTRHRGPPENLASQQAFRGPPEPAATQQERGRSMARNFNTLPRPTEPLPKLEPVRLMVKAMYNFSAEEKDELTFNCGDVIKVLDQSDPSWWRGELRGREGLFPSNYTKPV